MKPNSTPILQTCFAFWASKVLLSAVELDVFSELARQPQNFTSLRKRLGLHERGARDFLDALVALRFLQREGECYANTPETEHFLDKAKPSYIGGIVDLANQLLYSQWSHLTDSLLTGRAPGGDDETGAVFDAIYRQPDKARMLLQGMSGISRPANVTIARQFPWSQHKSFADIGTAQGDLAVQIALVNPHLAGIGFDLPPVMPYFNEYVAKNDLETRLSFAVGNFFTDSLPPADVILFGHILHDWNLDEKKLLLRKAYEALPQGGAVIVYESLIDDDRRENAFGMMMSLNMLVGTSGGFDFTGADCRGWMEEAGFRDIRQEHLTGPDSMMVGIK